MRTKRRERERGRERGEKLSQTGGFLLINLKLLVGVVWCVNCVSSSCYDLDKNYVLQGGGLREREGEREGEQKQFKAMNV
jgi:hypothetical protein